MIKLEFTSFQAFKVLLSVLTVMYFITRTIYIMDHL